MHISSGSVPMMRIGGELTPIPDIPVLTAQQVDAIILPSISEQNRRIYNETMELDFAVQAEDERFRGNLFRTTNGTAAVFRHIQRDSVDLVKLGVPEPVISLSNLRNGLVLVVGPVASGKSSTIAGIIDIINSTRKDHIITIEDPVEFVHPNKMSLVNQREVGSTTKSFANALKGVLREDPDVILVGEMRDLETMRLALTAAESGKLVFATLHTISAAQTVNRIIDCFPTGDRDVIRSMLSISLKAVVCQKLVKAAKGGRCGVFEIMFAIPSIKNLIRENKIHQIPSMIEVNKKMGMVTMKEYLNNMVSSGMITQEIATNALVEIANES